MIFSFLNDIKRLNISAFIYANYNKTKSTCLKQVLIDLTQ